MTKLTFEAWCEKVGTVVVSEETREAFKSFPNVDVDNEVEQALRQQYEIYLNTENNNE